MQEDWKYRTEQCTVPSGALDKTDRLFTAEVTEREERERRERRGRKIIAGAHAHTHTHTQCLKFFQSKWHIVNFKFSEFSASFGKLLR